MFKEIMSSKTNSSVEKLTINNVLKFMRANDMCSIYPNLSTLYHIFLTLPISSAGAERSFSRLKLIKSYLRSTMTGEIVWVSFALYWKAICYWIRLWQSNGLLCENEAQTKETFVELYKYNVDTSWKTAYFFFWSFDLKCTIKSLFISFIYLLNFISYSQSKIKVYTKYCIWERVSLQVF